MERDGVRCGNSHHPKNGHVIVRAEVDQILNGGLWRILTIVVGVAQLTQNVFLDLKILIPG